MAIAAGVVQSFLLEAFDIEILDDCECGRRRVRLQRMPSTRAGRVPHQFFVKLAQIPAQRASRPTRRTAPRVDNSEVTEGRWHRRAAHDASCARHGMMTALAPRRLTSSSTRDA